MPGYNDFAGYDPVNQVAIVIWSDLTVGLDDQQTVNALLGKVVGRVYELPAAEPAPTTPR